MVREMLPKGRALRRGRALLSMLLAISMVCSTVPAFAVEEVIEQVSVAEVRPEIEENGGSRDDGPFDDGPADEVENVPTDPQSETVVEVVVSAASDVETYVPDVELPSNEELLEGYAELQLEAALPKGEIERSLQSKRSLRSNVSNRLSEDELSVYSFLKENIVNVANTTVNTSTQFTVSGSDQYGGSTFSWTEDELGTEIVVDGAIANEAMDAAIAKIKSRSFDPFDVSLDTVMGALTADCPYDLYWYDKTDGVSLESAGGFSFGAHGSNGEWVLDVDLSELTYTYSFAVAGEYSAGEYMLDTTASRTIAGAVAMAQQIVDDNAGLGMYGRMEAYKNAICNEVSYNFNAASDEYAGGYGNPWQLIWVFDGDSTTNVVCEGYSKAFKYLMDLTPEFDDRCILATGSMAGGTGAGPHMWNIVRMDDERSYLVDVTNCDEGSIGAPDQLFVAIPDSGSVADGYVVNTTNGYEISPITYQYDAGTTSLYGKEAITLSDTAYVEPAPKQDISAASVSVSGEAIVYSGEEWEPAVTVNLGGVELVGGVDYSVSYADNVNAGTATVVVTGAGNYVGSASVTFEIAEADSSLALTNQTSTYTSAPIAYTGEVTRTGSDGALTISYFSDSACSKQIAASDVVDADTYYVKATLAADQNHESAESNVATFTINPAAITSIAPIDGAFEPVPVVRAGELDVPEGGYDVSYEDNLNAGTATVTVAGKGNFQGTRTATFSIAKAPRAVELTEPSFSKALGDEPFPLGASLSAGDGTLSYASSDEAVATVGADGTVSVVGAGEATVTAGVPETANYEAASAQAVVTVAKAAPAALTGVSLDASSFTYDGRAHVPAVAVTAGGVEVPEGGYGVRYLRGGEETTDLTSAGTVTVEVTGRGDYAGVLSEDFAIAPAAITSIAPIDGVVVRARPRREGGGAGRAGGRLRRLLRGQPERGHREGDGRREGQLHRHRELRVHHHRSVHCQRNSDVG